jgi:hypothetical protein
MLPPLLIVQCSYFYFIIICEIVTNNLARIELMILEFRIQNACVHTHTHTLLLVPVPNQPILISFCAAPVDPLVNTGRCSL